MHKLFPSHTCIEVGPRPDLMKLAPACIPFTDTTNAQDGIHWVGSSSPIFCKSGTSNTRAQFDAAVTTVFKQKNIGQTDEALGGGRISPQYTPKNFPWRVLDPSMMLSTRNSGIAVANSSALLSTHHQSDVVKIFKDVIRDAILAVITIPSGLAHLEDDSSLLSLGIDSLGAIEIRNRIFSALNERYDIPSTLLLTHPSITMVVNFLKEQEVKKALEHEVNGAPDSNTSEESGSDEETDCASFPDEGMLYDRRDIVRWFPATRVQQAMIYHHLVSSEANTFVESFVWRVTSAPTSKVRYRSWSHENATIRGSVKESLLNAAVPLDIVAMHRAWMDVAIEHSCLRSSFDTTVTPVRQFVWKHSALGFDANRVPATRTIGNDWFEHIKVPEILNSSDMRAFITSSVKQHRSKPFDLTVPPLFRVKIIEFIPSVESDSKRYLMIFTAHHCVMDGRSVSLILESLSKHYKLRSAPGSSWSLRAIPRAPSYSVFARKEENLLLNHSSPEYRKMALHWNNVLSSYMGPYQFRHMPALVVNTSDDDVIRVRRDISSEFLQKLRAASSSIEVTIASFVHASWCLVHEAFTGAGSSLYGSTVSGRNSCVVKGASNIVGPLINTVPVCVAVTSNDRLVDHIVRVHHHLVEGMAFENFPLTEITLPQGVSRAELTSIIVDFQQNEWDMELMNSNDMEVDLESSVAAGMSIQIHDGQLFDRICCPLTIRIVSANGSISLFATSECKDYDSVFLKLLLSALERTMTTAVDDILKHGKVSSTTVSNARFRSKLNFEKTRNYPPPELPLVPGQSEVKINDGFREKYCLGDWVADAVVESQFSSAFCLLMLRWCSSLQFSIKTINFDTEVHTYQFDSAEYSPLTLSNVSDGLASQYETFQSSLPIATDATTDQSSCIESVIQLHRSKKGLSARGPSSRMLKGQEFLFLCFHAAGANAGMFAGWETEMQTILGRKGKSQTKCKFISFDYPGHGDRRLEGCRSNLKDLILTLEKEVVPIVNEFLKSNDSTNIERKYFMLGYSLGSLVAYELSLRLQQSCGCEPCALFLFSEAAPMHCNPDVDPNFADDIFLEQLCNFGWFPRDVISLHTEDPDSMKYLIDVARSDMQVEESYIWDMTNKKVLRSDLYIFVGDQDPLVPTGSTSSNCGQKIMDWSHVISGDFSSVLIPGAGHMFMTTPTAREKVFEIIVDLSADPASQDIFHSYLSTRRFLLCDVSCCSKSNKLNATFYTNVDEIPDVTLTAMATQFTSLLDIICSTDPGDWKKPLDQLIPLPTPTEPVSPPCPVDGRLLHEPFMSHSISPIACMSEAVVGTDASGQRFGLSYQKLRRFCDAVSVELCELVRRFREKEQISEESSCVIAVVMEKGWEQVVGVLSIHNVQSTYLPIDARLWPEQRVKQVVEMSGAVAVLTQTKVLAASDWLLSMNIPVIDVNSVCDIAASSLSASEIKGISGVTSLARADPSDLGYLIYTSGSTGVPKGVCCHHMGAMNTIVDLNERFSVEPSDRILALSSLSFDLSVYDIFGLLTAGGRVVIPTPDIVSPPDPAEWFELLSSEGITIWNTVPAFVELLVSHAEFTGGQLPASLRLIFMSGDWIPVTLPARIRSVSACSDIRVISMGGATEAAIWSNMFELGKHDTGLPVGWNSVPYGRPLRNQTMLVLDETYRHCEAWVPGVIYIGGAGVASGYYKDPDRTAYQFVHHPVTGERLFRTGDLGRVRPCGNIEILGREDSQVKVNGFRIELGEIERVLMQHESVSSAALAVHNNTLCAYIVFLSSATEEGFDEEYAFSCLRDICKQSLTDYMIPKYFTRLALLPLSSNGKLQRDKLPKPLASAPGISDAGSSLLTETENAIAMIWSSVLSADIGSIRPDTNFFSIGGDSLRSLQVISSARRRNILMTVTQIFENPSLSALASVVTMIESSGPVVLGTSSSSLSTNPAFDVVHCPDKLFSPYPLIGTNQAHFVGLHTSSFSSVGIAPQIYFEWEVGADERHPGQVHIQRLEAAINCFIRRHPTFRSYVREDGMMQIVDPMPVFKIEKINEWNGSNAISSESLVHARDEMTRIGPSTNSWPMFEIRVTHTGVSQSIIHVTVSLFLMDAMSDLILRQELSALYRVLSENQSLIHDKRYVDQILGPPPQLLFRDYSVALHEKLHMSDEYKRAKEFWNSRFPTLSSGPEIPMAIENKSVDGRFKNQHRWLSAVEWRRAKSNCANFGVTIPAILLAAYSLVISRWSRNKRFLLNILQCLRHQVHEDVNSVVGNCSSTILCDINMETDVIGAPGLNFLTAVQRVAKELSQNLEHASMSGVDVMQELNRTQGRTFQAVAPFIFTTPIGVEKGNKDVQTRDWMFQERFFSERVPHTACVNAIKSDPSGTACASLDIIDGVFPDEVVRGMFNMYSLVLDIICSTDPADWKKPLDQLIPLPTPTEPVSPPCPVDGRLLHEPFMSHSISPIACMSEAVVGTDASGQRFGLSYQKLRRFCDAVSVELCELVRRFREKEQISEESSCVIAVVMEKGWEQVVGVLSIHNVQSTYLPIDARLWPEQRVKQVVEMSGAVAVLTQTKVLAASDWLLSMNIPVIDVNSVCDIAASSLSASEIKGISGVTSLARADPSDLGYLIYTSGSTGVPKGVCCHHMGAMNTIVDLNERFSVEPSDRILALSSLSFDLSVYDIFGLLTAGGRVVIPTPDIVSPPDPAEWFELLSSEGITIWNTVPAFVELLVSHAEFTGGQLPASLRLIFMSGDWIPVTLPARIRSVSACSDIRVISMGGATEAAIWSNMFELGKHDTGLPVGWNSVPYGRPLRNQTMLVLDETYRHCEAWVPGVIYIGGAGVASGYYKDPDRTAYQFVHHPVTGERLFRTGDLGRVRPCGNIEILGREDSQVKVNGFRIELGEIERVLMQHESVSSAALAVHNNTLCAYVVWVSDMCQETSVAFVELKELCRSSLTDYMIPKHFIALSKLPLSSNGKLQRDKLPKPTSNVETDRDNLSSSSRAIIAPMSELENDVRESVSDVLSIDPVSVCCRNDTFFGLGGNSITAIRLIFQLRKRFDCSISVQQLFDTPTIVGISDAILQSSKSKSTDLFEANKIETIRLNKGNSSSTPIILVNPAGASGLW